MGELADFCTAHYGVSETNVVREALKWFMQDRLAAEPEMRKRYERARKERLEERGNIRVLDSNGD